MNELYLPNKLMFYSLTIELKTSIWVFGIKQQQQQQLLLLLLLQLLLLLLQ